MNQLYLFADLCGGILDLFVVSTFFSAVARIKRENVTFKRTLIVFYTILFSFSVLFIKEKFVNTLIMFLFLFLLSLFYEMTFLRRVIFSMMMMIIMMLSEITVGLMLSVFSGHTVEQISENVIFYTTGVLFSKLLAVIVIKTIRNFSAKTEVRIQKRMFFPLMLLPVATFIIADIMGTFSYKFSEQRPLLLIMFAIMCLILSNILLFYYWEKQLQEADNKRQSQLKQQYMEYQMNYFKDLAEKQRISNQTLHNLKNQLFAIEEILRNNSQQGIQEIERLCDRVLAVDKCAFSGIDSVDALLSVKQKKMQDHNIVFTSYIYIPEHNTVDHMDLCVLLGCLLDNAIEACMKIDSPEPVTQRNKSNAESKKAWQKRQTDLTITQKNEYLSIVISNTVSNQVLADEEDGKIRTSKKDKELHGFGLQSMSEIVEKYNGHYNFVQNGLVFSVILLLENRS